MISIFMLFSILAIGNANSARVRHAEVKAVKALPHAASTKESDREIQEAYEELADFASTRSIEWNVEGNNTVRLPFNRNADGQDHWITWTVTNSNLKAAVDKAEKVVYDFPEGYP